MRGMGVCVWREMEVMGNKEMSQSGGEKKGEVTRVCGEKEKGGLEIG